MKSTTTRIALLFAAVFVFGGLTGAGLVRLAVARQMRNQVLNRLGSNDLHALEWLLTADLDLAPEQLDRIRAVVAAHQAEVLAVRRRCEPGLRSVRQQVQEEIRSFLTPPQQEKFARLVAGLEVRRGEILEGR